MADSDSNPRGPLAWMARNSVAANLLLFILLAGGLVFASRIQQEVFPEARLDQVMVTVPYPGATPAEVEQGVVLPVEEAVQGIDGVKEVRSVAAEALGTVTAELFTSADKDRALNDIKSSVDRITSFPRDVEEPIIRLASNRREVVSLILYGDLEETTLYTEAERVRSELLQDPRITIVEVGGFPPPEISIEVPQAQLRRYGLTLPEVARRVDAASIELGGGALRTERGEVLVRTLERRDVGEEFRNLAIIHPPDGSRVRLEEIATIRDDFRETDQAAFFNGQRAARLRVFRLGNQTPLDVSRAVRDYVEEARHHLPSTLQVAVWNDNSEIFENRIGLLLKNGFLGACLILVILGLFLQPRLAFWVMVGMTASFVGAFLFMPALGVSINMISLFAFILVLGIVVDDAIVVGEAVHYHQQREGKNLEAVIRGVREVAAPVTFSVLTTVIAFTPLLFVPGVTGKFFANIPLIVIPILILSLTESLLVLPSHLAHTGRSGGGRAGNPLARFTRLQQAFARGLERFVETRYAPMADRLLRCRYVTLAASTGLLAVMVGLVLGGRIQYHYFPDIEGEIARASLALPFGAPVEATRQTMDHLVESARRVLSTLGGEEQLSRGIYAELGQEGAGELDPQGESSAQSGGHLASVAVFLPPPEARAFTVAEFTRRWRGEIGELAGIDRLSFEYNVGPAAGANVAIELAHDQTVTLERAAARLADALRTYRGVFDVDDGFRVGKEQLNLTLKPAAKSLGISEEDLARQVRSAFFGAEALRQQRRRDELRVYVRLPRSERDSEYHFENLIIRTPGGGEIPLHQAATVSRGRSFTVIEREQARRVVDVTADVDAAVTSAGEVTASLQREVLPRLLAETPGLAYELSGEQQDQQETIRALQGGITLALLAIFSLLAVAFRSYVQPLLVMFAIPFGIVGAVAGHFIMGHDLSMISLFGMVALAGVVVNDSLALIAVINRLREEGHAPLDAIREGAVRRFRPILLTSLTTFFGLTPMIFETSVQARFLIPMAISLGFGVLFVTVITLIIVPASYMVLEDLRGRRVPTQSS